MDLNDIVKQHKEKPFTPGSLIEQIGEEGVEKATLDVISLEIRQMRWLLNRMAVAVENAEWTEAMTYAVMLKAVKPPHVGEIIAALGMAQGWEMPTAPPPDVYKRAMREMREATGAP